MCAPYILLQYLFGIIFVKMFYGGRLKDISTFVY